MRRFVGAAGKPTGGENATDVIPAICYGLFVLAWIVDLVTPQAFVVSILLSGPIALSTLALQSRLTVRLTILAEIANVIAGYVNGAQAGYHWDAIAIGDRAISAATFVLVAALTIRAQGSARRAGESDERRRQIERERLLRAAMEHVRASLNLELVLRAAVREAANLTSAPHVTLSVRPSSLEIADVYELRAGESDVTLSRVPLPPEIASLAERARSEARVAVVDPSEPLGRMIGEFAYVAAFEVAPFQAVLVVGHGSERPSDADRDMVQAFADNLEVALRQAELVIRLYEQNREIARQKDELQARGDVIRDIVYALAHDLRTPLSAADVTMKQALTGAYGEMPPRYRDILASSIESNEDLQRLVETLLLVARYESGEDSPVKALESALALAERVVTELRPMAEAASLQLDVEPQTDNVNVFVDAGEIRRALTNLLANAIRATPPHGRVRVVITHPGNRVRVDVVDDGFGVPPERRPYLFRRFLGTRAGAGTGLGLYIVRRIAEKHDGMAGYEPAERGSRFFIELPEAATS